MLAKNIFDDDAEMMPTRHGFGDALLALGKKNKNVVALCADLSESTRMHLFKAAYPKRFVQVGVAEQNMMTVAAGMALSGKIPFAASYATFNPGRSWDQIRVGVCYNEANVKFTGHHAGLLTGEDGATHEALEDIALLRVLPNMTIFVPCDYHEAYKATIAAAALQGPVYIRLGRAPVNTITTKATPFVPGKILPLRKGKDVAIFATGTMVYEALCAARDLEKTKIYAAVYNVHTIKPLDERAVVVAAKTTGAVVTAEEHQVTGGLGGAIAETLAEHLPTPMRMVGVQNTFGESGKPRELLKKYGLTAKNIVMAATALTKQISKK